MDRVALLGDDLANDTFLTVAFEQSIKQRSYSTDHSIGMRTVEASSHNRTSSQRDESIDEAKLPIVSGIIIHAPSI